MWLRSGPIPQRRQGSACALFDRRFDRVQVGRPADLTSDRRLSTPLITGVMITEFPPVEYRDQCGRNMLPVPG
jgi:hypothetical protein